MNTRTVYYTSLPKGLYRADVGLHPWGDRYLVQILPDRGSCATEAHFDTFEAASAGLDQFLDWIRGGRQLPEHPSIARFYSASI